MHYDQGCVELNIGHAENVSYDSIEEKGGLGLGMVGSMTMITIGGGVECIQMLLIISVSEFSISKFYMLLSDKCQIG